MKQLITIVFILLFTAVTVFSEETETKITIGGEIKTGVFWYDRTQFDSEGEFGNFTGGFIHNGEDTNWTRGTTDYDTFKEEPGRFRLNFQVEHGNIGTKFRFEATALDISAAKTPVKLSYAFAYGYLWDRQIKISAGLMGDSPWGTGGPEMWRELDTRIGMRFELIPSFIPFIKPGQLNLGFVLNDLDTGRDAVIQASDGARGVYFDDVMRESVIGLSYHNDWMLLRTSYRFDSDADGGRGETLIYRLEERALQKLVPGLQIFANGYIEGLGIRLIQEEIDAKVDVNDLISTTNWLYLQYAPQWFTAQVRAGLSAANQDQGQYYIRASFYYNLFDNLISIGPAFEFANDYGTNRKGDTYLRWFIEPQIRFNFADGCYVSLVYRYQDDVETRNPVSGDNTTLKTITNWINLRAVLTF